MTVNKNKFSDRVQKNNIKVVHKYVPAAAIMIIIFSRYSDYIQSNNYFRINNCTEIFIYLGRFC